MLVLHKKERKLSEMTLEELWKLLPIILVQHDEKWKDSYKEIEQSITKLLSNKSVDRISHIGSTAIQGIWSKDIIDVMIEIPEISNMKDIATILEQNGFTIMSEKENRISLNKGYTINGFADKVYHIHLRYTGDNDELYFRDYLNEHPNVAKEYETLKLHLWKKYKHNRDAYTEAKTEFISKWTSVARNEYRERY
ncbi:MAG: GrpB family protein [Clostridia bacterium]|nr:GrpB family protein [Clostridia bacterium]